MKYKIILPFFIMMFFIIIFSFGDLALAYDSNSTHPALTNEIVNLYNSKFGDKFYLNAEFHSQLLQGSIDEDIPPRWLNHFYDPVHNKAWDGACAGTII